MIISATKKSTTTFKQKRPQLTAYLAGADVFLSDAIKTQNQDLFKKAKEMGRAKESLLAKIGIKGHFPLDNVLDLSQLTKHGAGRLISEANEKLAAGSDIGLFNLTPFRGPSADVGTIYEAGFMAGLGKKLYGYTNTTKMFFARTKDFFKNEITEPQKGILLDGNKMLLEDFDMHDNCMIDGGILARGGKIIATEVPEDEMHKSLAAFEKLMPVLEEDKEKILRWKAQISNKK